MCQWSDAGYPFKLVFTALLNLNKTKSDLKRSMAGTFDATVEIKTGINYQIKQLNQILILPFSQNCFSSLLLDD